MASKWILFFQICLIFSLLNSNYLSQLLELIQNNIYMYINLYIYFFLSLFFPPCWRSLSWKPWFQKRCLHQKIKELKNSKNDYFLSLCNPYSKGRTLKKFFLLTSENGRDKSHKSWALPELIHPLGNMASFFISLLRNPPCRGLGDIYLFDSLSCILKCLMRGLISPFSPRVILYMSEGNCAIHNLFRIFISFISTIRLEC